MSLPLDNLGVFKITTRRDFHKLCPDWLGKIIHVDNKAYFYKYISEY